MSFAVTLAEALLVLRVDDSKVDPELQKAQQKFQQRMDKFGRVAEGVRNAATVGMIAGLAMINSFADAATEKEAQISRYRAQMEILGGIFRQNADATEEWASKMEKLHDFDSDDILEQFQKAGSATKDYGESVLLLETAMELANLKGADVADTTQKLTMAYAGNVRGLRTMGIFLEQGVKGHEAIVAVQKQVAGGSEKTAETVARSERKMQIAWENSREKLGKDLQPTLIKLYGTLGQLAQTIEHLDGRVILWSTGLLGLVAIIAQVYKWVIDLQAAKALLALTTDRATAANARNAASLRALHPASIVAVAAIASIAAAWKKAAEAAQEYREAQGSKKAPYVLTERGLQTTNEIGAETSPTDAQMFWADMAFYLGLNKPGETASPSVAYREQTQRMQDAQLTMERMREQQAEARARRMERTSRNQSNRPTQDVRQQLAGMI